LTRAQWLEDRRAELLAVEYFHVVFTLPQRIQSIAFIAVLHTWDHEARPMDAHEQRRVVSVNARASSWPLAERRWLRARARAYATQPQCIHYGTSARAADLRGTVGSEGLFATANLLMNSAVATHMAPIQYPSRVTARAGGSVQRDLLPTTRATAPPRWLSTVRRVCQAKDSLRCGKLFKGQCQSISQVRFDLCCLPVAIQWSAAWPTFKTLQIGTFLFVTSHLPMFVPHFGPLSGCS
jgi:hypothetical protein